MGFFKFFFLNGIPKSFARSEVLQHNKHIFLRCESVGFANPYYFFPIELVSKQKLPCRYIVPYFPRRKNKSEVKKDLWSDQLHNSLGFSSQQSLTCQDLKPLQKNLYHLSKMAHILQHYKPEKAMGGIILIKFF